MLTQEQNERLVRTGPGTEMGDLLRRYWIPALLAEEIPEPDCPPVRVQLLGERLIAFRDTKGRVGLLDEMCSHRTASLFFARNEECGLRCAYHGWKYDIEGNCVDMPSEPVGSRFRERIKHPAYPCVERGGVVWTYMGPAELKPAPPELEWAMLPGSQRFVSKRLQETNFLQAMEGGIDSSHVSFAHRFNMDDDPMHAGTEGLVYLKNDTRPKFEVSESDGGLLIGARRTVDEERYYWRVTQWIMPWYTIIPPFGTHNPLGAHAWVPIDDETCWAWSINYHPTRDLREDEVASMVRGEGIHAKYIPGTYRTLANAGNDYLIDRQAQRDKRSFSGVEGIAAQDFSLQESMGPIVDRTKERLGTSDAAIILARRRLLAAAETARGGGPVPGLAPEHHRVRSTSVLLPKGTPFQEGAQEALVAKPGEEFVSI
ncbi:aromatic ring-hydroxylating dioxygenase subunit alpha [Amycolatopsis acidiphila]|uniref:Aromatic ring-hydroxylating dioxygenase subunit alpha n=1 Tax=Amycolatopsis acidiphila TaxID=715473 RepID=A0A558AL24_9PSEU|nr:Rieske 2Fe-2S domain-containing protein [Amycolatopsis acidiphila]TVT24968.1 aromatic ring-hydroxylating dioxygenase subunit alpha [Amycolatopsis acidiphila]UIJ57528.1 aromatic ring-hydroxylating dioxygenase subunit alpha [Amycolatopsis acidiphila]GHG89295.1 ring-hydroxylating oxygenase subunit alpha [Amycolatopsis acidiphila]